MPEVLLMGVGVIVRVAVGAAVVEALVGVEANVAVFVGIIVEVGCVAVVVAGAACEEVAADVVPGINVFLRNGVAVANQFGAEPVE